MWYKIKEGKHRASPLSLGIHFGKTSESYEVMFDESCLYEPIDWEDDINKLVGWSYGLHHNNSIRIGWRPSRSESNSVEVSLYIYDSGIRTINEYVVVVPIDTKLAMSLQYNKGYVSLCIANYGLILEEVSMIPKWGYNLGCFFGGNEAAPHDMKIWLRKLS